VNYATLRPGSLRLTPPADHWDAWQRDYEEMAELMFYGAISSSSSMLLPRRHDAMKPDELRQHIETFFSAVGRREIDIYNEFSLQHEFGIWLREKAHHPALKIQYY
jgi:hypothetical protein